MLRIYQRFWQVNWAEQWQYRANLLMYLAYWLVSPIVYLTVWSAIANGAPGGSIGGLSAADFAAYYLTLLAVDIMTSSITIHILGYKIQDGSISNELLRPVHPILTNTLVNNLAFKALQLIVFVPVWFLLGIVFQPQFTYTTDSILSSAPAIALGFLLNFLLDGIITLLAFWTTRVWAIQEVSFAVGRLFNGAFVPLVLLPGWMQDVAQVLPYQLWSSFPTLTLLNKLAPQQIAVNYGLQLVWLVILFIGFQRLWKHALKRFSAVGA